MRFGVGLALVLAVLSGCRAQRTGEPAPSPPPSASVSAPAATDPELDACKARLSAVEAEPALPGAPELDARRAELFGRARGEPVIWVREPRVTPEAELSVSARATAQSLSKRPGFTRVRTILNRHKGDRPTLRALLLREGYVYSSEPAEALALVSQLELTALFDEPRIFLQHGQRIDELVRSSGRFPSYRTADGSNAELLLGDRVAVSRDELRAPLHRDLRALAHEVGFDRARISRRTAGALVAELRLAGSWTQALLDSDGAELSLNCLVSPKAERERLRRTLALEAPRRAALASLRGAIDAQVAEAVPFDRPRDEKTAEKDGQLRPDWRWAYKRGQAYFSHEEVSYPVFDAKGRPLPPQMCVDFVLDSFERASGTWFRAKGEVAERRVGALDFDSFGIKNRRAVLAFEQFAVDHPELFEHERMKPEERIPFGERSRFFAFLLKNSERFQPGDIVAIQGKKADGLIHQHAILIEDTDPITGFPYALADQMKRPRRRTWEGIMAEAPLRSLLFHVRPKERVVSALAPVASVVTTRAEL